MPALHFNDQRKIMAYSKVCHSPSVHLTLGMHVH